ncbi:MAG: ribosome modulation factor [Porticoccaceae bacterium]|nr:MAG: ribosome modulation factor [Porticoccaceae bacterium]
MKRQKRDPAHRAFVRGYQAGFAMKSRSACPFPAETPAGREWLRGWREGREDQWRGYNQAACQQKVSSL